MRQGQQNRRGRGRSTNNNNNNSNQGHSHNNGRKPQNPLSRNYESSGPDQKIRGTAAQIAEKYTTLARDASSSGDPVLAENYLQHAEHYNRIIMAAQAQAAPLHQHQPQQHGGEHGHGMNGQHRPAMDGPPPPVMREQPQPVIEQPQAQVAIPGLEPQPDIVETPQDETAAAPASDASAPREADGGRPRRRRRYPAGGPSRAAAPAEASPNGHNGSGNGLDSAGENRPPDEALAN